MLNDDVITIKEGRMESLIYYNAGKMVDFIAEVSTADDIAYLAEYQEVPEDADSELKARLRSNHLLECIIYLKQEGERQQQQIKQQLRRIGLDKTALKSLEERIAEVELCLRD